MGWGAEAVVWIAHTTAALPAATVDVPHMPAWGLVVLSLGLAWLGLKLGENWRELGKYFHEFDVVVGVVLAAGIIWFVWSHWQNRIRTA